MPRPAVDKDHNDLLDASLALAQTQLIGQLADETSLDGRIAGVLGFNGALLAADVAAKSLLGAFWWAALLGVGLTAFYCLRPPVAASVESNPTSDLGPRAATFYRAFIGQPSAPAREQLLYELGDSFANNARRIEAKRRALQAALIALTVGLIVSATLLAAY